MRISAKPPHAVDPVALETRTREIGEALFARARQEHAQLSVLNRWTAQVLSWCLSDPALKSRVLRFIDVLPSLGSPRAIAQHVLDYFPPDQRLPAGLRLGSTLARSGMVTASSLALVTKQLTEQVARQFIAESHPEAARRVVAALAQRGATCSVDLLGEQVLSQAEADRYAARCQQLLKDLHEAYRQKASPALDRVCGPLVNVSVKPSALTPKFDPICPARSLQEATRRLLPLLQLADQLGALVNLDMEHYELRDLTLALAKHLLVHPAVGENAELGIVIQAYLRDAASTVEQLLDWLCAHERPHDPHHAAFPRQRGGYRLGRPLTIRLVKGAYWDHEVAVAAARHWPTPVHLDKAATDQAFESLTIRLLGAYPLVRTAIASHNVRSIGFAMAAAEQLEVPPDQLEFQLLYGMGESLQAAILARGYPVRVYTPIGELIPGMAYLVRRILENTANESFLRQDFLQARPAESMLAPPMPRAPATETSQIWRGDPPLDFSAHQTRIDMEHALQRVKGQLDQRYPVLLGDQDETGQEPHPSRNPANPRQILGHMAYAGLAEVNHAVRCAAGAQPAWAAWPVEERAACLRRAASLMRQQRHELVAWEILEVGKPWREADGDVVEAIDFLEYYSLSMIELARGKPLWQVSGERNELRYVPRGVAVVIAPWNFPAGILTGMTAAALVTGNAAILKPAEPSSLMAHRITRLLREAGVPSAIVQCLPGHGPEVGAALVRHPGTHVVLFTGSKAVGLSLLQACALVGAGQRFVKHLVAELGGKNAIIVDEDADLDAAVASTLVSAFGYSGQKCSAASRVIVLDPVYERFVRRLAEAMDRLVVGNPEDPATDVGPLIEAAAQQRVLDAISQAREAGSVVYAYPSSRIPTEGYFVGPTLVADVPPQHALAREELFGPLVCLFRAKRFDEALQLANDSAYALTGGVFSRSPAHIAQAIRAFDVGNLYINRQITGAAVGRQPFGGHRLSGLGTKAGGPDYLLELTVPKTVAINTARHGMPLE